MAGGNFSVFRQRLDGGGVGGTGTVEGVRPPARLSEGRDVATPELGFEHAEHRSSGREVRGEYFVGAGDGGCEVVGVFGETRNVIVIY